jgi:hypothetical protein
VEGVLTQDIENRVRALFLGQHFRLAVARHHESRAFAGEFHRLDGPGANVQTDHRLDLSFEHVSVRDLDLATPSRAKLRFHRTFRLTDLNRYEIPPRGRDRPTGSRA